MSQNNVGYSKKDAPAALQKTGFILLIIGLALGAAGFFFDSQRALINYLLAYVFILSIAVGALFLMALEYLANADWSTPIRRVVEFFASVIPLLFVLVIPLLLNISNIFEWTHPEAKDAVLQSKAPYLNITFFIVRSLVCIAVWTAFFFFMSRNSRKQDFSGDQSLTRTNVKLSAAFIPLFAITMTFSSIDWMMSLAPHWFSTIFGVYFFSGSLVATLAAVTLAVIMLRERGMLHSKMVDDHYYSLGALMFGFVNFWAYIAFSQFLLIWYANLPEETVWFLARWSDGWLVFSILLIFMHFIIPYALLLPQPAKLDPKRLKFVSVWLLIAHFVDLYWLIMPSYHGESKGFLSYVFDFAFPIAAVGVFLVVFFYQTRKHNLVPIKDPKLERGLNFRL